MVIIDDRKFKIEKLKEMEYELNQARKNTLDITKTIEELTKKIK